MRRPHITYLILLSTIILSCGQESEGTRKMSDSKTKLYYLDSISVDANDSSYTNGHFRLAKERVDNFRFSTPTDTTEIFYDKSFSQIAERIVFIIKDSVEHYERFDRNGNLTADYLYKNGHSWKQKTWNKNKNLERVVNYNEQGWEINDTSFFENGKAKEVGLYNNYTLFKEIFFYRNGNIAKEIFDVPDHSEHEVGSQYFSVFTITYDSLTQKQSMYYNNDTTWEDKNNPGTFVGYTRLIPADSAEVRKVGRINSP